MIVLISLAILVWVAASMLVTQACFQCERTKLIHLGHVKSESFARLAAMITGRGAELCQQSSTNRTDT
ncbi:MAG: hypothetical protein KTR27_04210 [Leptolyngbyaceae cyanobacterium MAG.088]|nr:hypothetical protein [Leptolyngbyaceae cyanobacterium MAG.088]